MWHVLNFHVTHVCCRPSPDAAHVHSRAGGQGMNSSVQDAFNIAWRIALVYKGLSPASLLDIYTAERFPVIAGMLGFTTKLHDRIFDPSDVEHTARSTADEDDNSKQMESKLEHAMHRSAKMYMLGVNAPARLSSTSLSPHLLRESRSYTAHTGTAKKTSCEQAIVHQMRQDLCLSFRLAVHLQGAPVCLIPFRRCITSLSFLHRHWLSLSCDLYLPH